MTEPKDLNAFFRHRFSRTMNPEEHLAMVEADRDASTESA